MATVAGAPVATRDGGAAELDEETVGRFAASLRGGLLRPSDPGDDDGRVLGNSMIDKRPALVARSSVAADVIPYLLELDSMWADKHIAWTRAVWADTQRYSTVGLDLIFPGFVEEGEDLVRTSVGADNYRRRAALKARYDPANLFRLTLNVTPRG